MELKNPIYVMDTASRKNEKTQEKNRVEKLLSKVSVKAIVKTTIAAIGIILFAVLLAVNGDPKLTGDYDTSGYLTIGLFCFIGLLFIPADKFR